MKSRTFNTDQVDREYNPRHTVPNAVEIMAEWTNRSQQTRRQTAGVFDLAYGASAAERLDLFPAPKAGGPLLVFIHGGYWRALHKNDFSWIAPHYARAGINVAIVNYELAPVVTLEEIVLQNLRAIAWLYRNVARYEIDPGRIVISGHSAGGHLTAMMLAAHWPVFGSDLPKNLVKSGIAISGVFDLEPIRHTSFLNPTIQLTTQRVLKLSPMLMPCANPNAKFYTSVGGKESDSFHEQTRSMGQCWSAQFAGDIQMPRDDHFSICDRFAEPGNPLHDTTVQVCLSS
jgi:arylformamidase